MKKTILLLLILAFTITLLGCQKEEKKEDTCDSYLGLENCTEVDFKVCDDCEDDFDLIKGYGFAKSTALSNYVGSFFEDYEQNSKIDFETSLNRNSLNDLDLSKYKVPYYNTYNQVKDYLFHITTNIDLCTNQDIVTGCVVAPSDDLANVYRYFSGEDVLTVRSTNFHDGNTLMMQSDNQLSVIKNPSNYQFEYIIKETGTRYQSLKNMYANYHEGVLRVYTHLVDDSNNETYSYYMYDDNTNNYVSYKDNSSETVLTYYISNHNKLYSYEVVKNINLAVLGVTYFDDLQDYVSLRTIKANGQITAVNVSFNLHYVEGWDKAVQEIDALFKEETMLDLNGYTLNPVTNNVTGTSNYRISKDFTITDFEEMNFEISGDLHFDSVEFAKAKTLVDNLILNSEGYLTAFGVTYDETVNELILSQITTNQERLID